MNAYDPLVPPDSGEWLKLDEAEREVLVADYHRRARVPLPRARRALHAHMHIVVENQIAAGDPSCVGIAVNRLISEGLDRHEAIHAVAAICIDLLNAMTRDQKPFSEKQYAGRLERLTAERWHRGDW
jgi:hypothetical protein